MDFQTNPEVLSASRDVASGIAFLNRQQEAVRQTADCGA
jgi:hypothetical protein